MRANATENESPSRLALRREVEAQVLAAATLYGPDQFNRAEIVSKFRGHGVSGATVYRWISSYLAGPEVGRAMQRLLHPSPTSADATRNPAETAAMVGEVIAGSGIVPCVSKALVPGMTLAETLGKLRSVIELGEEVIQHAKTPEGKIRMAKTALAGGAAVREAVKTYVQLMEAVTNATQMAQFVGEVVALFEAVGRRYPDVGQFIAADLQRITDRWRAQP